MKDSGVAESFGVPKEDDNKMNVETREICVVNISNTRTLQVRVV